MAKKTVAKLKKKHRDYIWRDEEGDYWYWDSITAKWTVILADYADGGFYTTNRYDPIYYNHFEQVGASPIITRRDDEMA